VLALRPGQAGATSAVVSTVGMVGIGFPALVGLVADVHGLSAAIGLYAAIPVIVLALTATGLVPPAPPTDGPDSE
jgi:hypothetical protein